MQFVLASHNQKKRKEMAEILGELGIEVVSLPENAPEPEETGATFEENAMIKAKSAAQYTGLPAIADDSGLCVDFLGGAPGIYSARFAGEHGNDEKNNDLLLEKPVSASVSACKYLLERAQTLGCSVTVCHVLRYAPFYQKAKELAASGALGRIIAIQASENVGYWHMAHSYVRGNWRRADETSPMILAKCCHDMDLIMWLKSGIAPTQVASFGSLRHFDAAHAPAGAPERCTDGCPHSEACPYYAPKIYLTDNVGWPTDMLTTDLSYEGRLKALREGPYGRCVYRCDNDVVDRQVVILAFDKGAVANFTMTAFTTDMARQLKICGTKGQITADMNTNAILLHRFGEAETRQIALEVPPQTNNYGHGGGDYFLMRDFVQAVWQAKSDTLSSAQASLQSHLICFAAELSRKEKKIVEL